MHESSGVARLRKGVGDLTIALVLWSGNYGGAETWSLSVARALRRRGVEVGVIVLCQAGPLCSEGRMGDLKCERLLLERGSQVLLRGKSLSKAISAIKPHAIIAPSSGYLSAVLRLSGYRGRIVAIEHGDLLQLHSASVFRRAVRLLNRLSGLWATDVQITPSDFMKRRVLRYPHCRSIQRIYPGLDLAEYPESPRDCERSSVVVGAVARLARGKGVDVLIRALGQLPPNLGWRLEVAGDGEERPELERLARELGLHERIHFQGWTHDIAGFWSRCDLAVVPSDEWIESFGMVAVEAMASGLAVIAARNGGLVEIVKDGETGRIFEKGNPHDLARHLAHYIRDATLRRSHGAAGRLRAIESFGIDRCAAELESLARELVGTPSSVLSVPPVSQEH
jgi:glycosyltransferase involved in cell wall biosynthesis